MNHPLPWVRLRLLCKALVRGFAQTLNPTHGSGWIVQVPSTDIPLNRLVIPPTAVGGYFKSSLRKGLERSTNCRWWDFNAAGWFLSRKHLNEPPTAVSGIKTFVQSPGAWLCTKALNPTHGSGWIGSGPFYRHTPNRLVIPP